MGGCCCGGKVAITVGKGQHDGHFDGKDAGTFGGTAVRHAFIRKVYGILTCQLAVTSAIIAVFLYVESVRRYSEEHRGMYYFALVITFSTLIALTCCPEVRRQSPTNLIVLGLFTICEGFLLGVVASRYDQEAVLFAVGMTGAVTVGLTIFAFQTKIDFTIMGGIMFTALIILFCFGLLTVFFRSRMMILIYSSIGALVFSGYLVFDTQLMLGGEHRYALSPEEYVFAALSLYLDIINLFLYILSIFGHMDD